MAEQNLIKKADLARAREIDFVYQFNDGIKKLMEALGVTRKIAKQQGTTLKAYKAVGTLENGVVGEGEVIPLSKYKTVPFTFDEITLKKWRKATSAEAIIERGYDQAHDMTMNALLKDIQKGIKNQFFNFLATGTTTAYGATFQAAIAQAWGKLQVLFEDTDIEAVYFMNQLDVADYLSEHGITLETAFGFSYLANFMGLGTVIFNSNVPRGTVYATAKSNIVLYYIPVNGAGLDNAFEFTADETGYIGIHENAVYDNMTDEDVAISGIVLFAERIDGIVVSTIGAPLGGATVTPEAAGTTFPWTDKTPADMQSGLTVSGNAISGTLKFIEGGLAQTGPLAGDGYFMALKFTEDGSAVHTYVGLEPSYGTGLVDVHGDPDLNGVFKVTDPKAQNFIVKTESATKTKTQAFDLSGIVLESTGA